MFRFAQHDSAIYEIMANPFLSPIELACAEPAEIQHNEWTVREHHC